MDKICVLGLGYVGLPLAIEFGKLGFVVGYDKNPDRVMELLSGFDRTRECSSQDLASAKYLTISDNVEALKDCNRYIVTVPTPIDNSKKPDLSPLTTVSETIGKVLKEGDIVIYESTVYPGVTEEICVPILERESKLKFNKDFFCGYSPERINPGDKDHRLVDIKKVTSGSNHYAACVVDELYRKIIRAGTWLAPSIKVAEAAKVIENTQRDLNIALMNELSLIFERLGIDTYDVLDAAATKWNFLNFKPGFVGGHCIGVDPYYLTYKAQSVNYNPEIILSGRRLNDDMPKLAAGRLVKKIIQSKLDVDAKILILGITFKENCPDVRNTKVVDFIEELSDFGFEIDVFDPVADEFPVFERSNVTYVREPVRHKYSALVLAVPHEYFLDKENFNLRNFCANEHLIFDVKGALPKNESEIRL